MVTELIQKYIWLVQTFIKAGDRGLLLEEIARAWELRWDSDYSRRTFNNHRQAIADIFGIEITCDRRTNRYHVPFAEEVADSNATAAWLINTFTINNLLTLGKERLSGRVSVEDIPSGQRWLTLLMEAMTGNRVIRIHYRKYTREEGEVLHVHPYALKEFARRWYLAGWCEERSAERVYGLDRIQDIAIEDATFKMPKNYDVEEACALPARPAPAPQPKRSTRQRVPHPRGAGRRCHHGILPPRQPGRNPQSRHSPRAGPAGPQRSIYSI